MNVFKKILTTKKNNNVLDEEIQKYVSDLENYEKNILRKYKIMMFYLKLSDIDVNNDEIALEFDSEVEKNEFLKLLRERGSHLKKFHENLKKLESLKIKVNDIFEKLNSSNDLDNSE